ncbi:MAG: hypothetical protein AAFW68_04570, partial [Pseudomonadota bacterium]
IEIKARRGWRIKADGQNIACQRRNIEHRLPTTITPWKFGLAIIHKTAKISGIFIAVHFRSTEGNKRQFR